MAIKQMYRYSKETLLAFASRRSCQTRPDGIDPVLWRDSSNTDTVEGGIAIPVVSAARGPPCRDSDLGGYSKSPIDDIPEWRRPNGGGAITQSGTRRKPYEEEPAGNAFSSSYPPRPTGPWSENNGPVRPPFDRPGAGPGPGPGPNGPPGRWDRFGDRDRERSRPPHDWDGDEFGSGGAGETGHRPWVERDGLLGSGNRPPPQGLPRLNRAAENQQLPRPLVKTPVYGRREETDTVNDETFGSLEASNKERAEEERKRRESFELMRKEQQRHLQEHKPPKAKADNPTVNRKHDENSLWDSPSYQSPPQSPIVKAVVPLGPPTPCPAVPPGFLKVAQQRLHQPLQKEEDALQGMNKTPAKGAAAREHISKFSLESDDKTDDSLSAHSSSSQSEVKECKDVVSSTKEMIVDSEVLSTKFALRGAAGATARDNNITAPGGFHGRKSQEASELWNFNLDGDNHIGLPSEILSSEDVVAIQQESLLDKLFGNAATGLIDGLLPPKVKEAEQPAVVPEEDNWSDTTSKTSKFAQWFPHEDETFLTASDFISTSETSSPRNLMSLFSKSEQSNTVGSKTPVEKSVQVTGSLGSLSKPGRSILPMPVGPSLEDIEKGLTVNEEIGNNNDHRSAHIGFLGHSNAGQGQPSSFPPVFMTCEDIEQAMLAEAAGSDSRNVTVGAKPVEVLEPPPKDASSASEHLLALLQKRPVVPDTGLPNGILVGAANQNVNSEWAWKNPGFVTDQGNKVHTLEALFGKAFMSELRPSEEPTMLGDNGFTSHKSEGMMIPLSEMQVGVKAQTKAISTNGLDGPPNWFTSSGPEWSSMWPDSKGVEASVQQDMEELQFSAPQVDHSVSADPKYDLHHMPSAPPISEFWGNSDFNQNHQNFVSLDALNGATASTGGPAFKLALSEGLDSYKLQKDGATTQARRTDGELTSGESSPRNSTNYRLMLAGKNLVLRTRTNDINANGIASTDFQKRLFASKDFPDFMGKVMANSVNGEGVTPNQGNSPQYKSSPRVTGFTPFSVERTTSQPMSTSMFRPHSPPGLPMQNMTAPPPPPRQLQQPSHDGNNNVFPHPSFRSQPQAPVFTTTNNNGYDFGFDGSIARPFAPHGHGHLPPSHTFHNSLAHQPPQFLGQPQILQRPQFYPGMIVQEHEGVKHQLPMQVPPSHHNHGQHLPNHAPPIGVPSPFNSDFSRSGGKPHGANGYNGVGNVERWFGADGLRSGLSGPSLIPQPPLGVEAT